MQYPWPFLAQMANSVLFFAVFRFICEAKPLILHYPQEGESCFICNKKSKFRFFHKVEGLPCSALSMLLMQCSALSILLFHDSVFYAFSMGNFKKIIVLNRLFLVFSVFFLHNLCSPFFKGLIPCFMGFFHPLENCLVLHYLH